MGRKKILKIPKYDKNKDNKTILPSHLDLVDNLFAKEHFGTYLIVKTDD